MHLQFVAMTLDYARDVLAWHYPAPYELYNNSDLTGSALDNEIAFLADPLNRYVAILDATGDLMGYAGVGFDAQVIGGDYTLNALDVGIGMRPDYTGRGLGTAIVAALLDYFAEKYHPVRFRATIAAFNVRSQRVFEKNGFQRIAAFTHFPDKLEFLVYLKECAQT
jgi:[ribosomal protein S18]-alanine N-acetyltransferase